MCCACEYLKYVVVTAAIFGREFAMRIPGPDYMTNAAAVAAMLVAALPATAQQRFVFDGHVHAVDRIFYHGGDIGERKADGQFDLSRAKEGGLGALFFSIFVTEDYYPGRLETRQALRMLDCAVDQIARNPGILEVAHTASDIERIHGAGKIAAVLDIEGSFDLDGDPAILREMYRLGLRSV